MQVWIKFPSDSGKLLTTMPAAPRINETIVYDSASYRVTDVRYIVGVSGFCSVVEIDVINQKASQGDM